jgi:hypothetical protein
MLSIFVLLMGCSPKVPQRPHKLAVFRVEAQDVELDKARLEELHEHIFRIVKEGEFHWVVPHDKLLRRLKRRRKKSERRCYSLRCQMRVGRRSLGANRSLATHIAKNLMSQCDVFTQVYNLSNGAIVQKVHTRASCKQRAVIKSVNRVVCGLLTRLDQPTDEPVMSKEECRVMADFLWVDRQLATMEKKRVRGSKRARIARERKMAENVLALKSEYKRVSRTTFPRWRVAATCRLGTLYDLHADQLAKDKEAQDKIPVSVRKMGKEATAEYIKQRNQAQRQRVAPFRDRASRYYQRCLDIADAAGVEDLHYLIDARQRLDALDRQQS